MFREIAAIKKQYCSYNNETTIYYGIQLSETLSCHRCQIRAINGEMWFLFQYAGEHQGVQIEPEKSYLFDSL